MLASAIAVGVLGLTCSSPSAAVAPPPKGRIAFYSDRDGVLQIYAMRPDGTDALNLSNNSAREVFPDWSPSGGQIAFASARDENWEIYAMNADGTGERRLTDNRRRTCRRPGLRTAARSRFNPTGTASSKSTSWTRMAPIRCG